MAKSKGSVLNQADYDEIDRRISETIEEKIAHLPTKDDFFGKMDEVLGEVQAMREDFAAHLSSHHELEHNDRNTLHKVKHLYQTFQIDEPADLEPAY